MDKLSTDKKRKKSSLIYNRDQKGWIFVAPMVIGFLGLFLPVFIDSIRYAFHQVAIQPGGGFVMNFVGWDNFHHMLRVDPYFLWHLEASARETLINLGIIVVFSMFVAVVLNSKMRGRAFFRAIFFIPVILATGIIARIDAQNSIMHAYLNVPGIDVGATVGAMDVGDSQGIISTLALRQYLMQIFNFNQTLVDMTVNAANNMYGVVNAAGVQILIFLAGLQSISPSIYEAAKMEGCSAWESFWKITLPLLSPLIFTNVIYTIVDSFTNPNNRIMHSIRGSMNAGQYGHAAAATWVYFLVAVVIIGGFSFFLKRVMFYQGRRDD